MNITDLSALELGQKIKSGEISPEEVLRATFERIRLIEPTVHSFLSLQEADAFQRAAQIRKQIADGTLTSPLAGVPIAVKDNICTRGIPTTCASRMLESFTPTYDATAFSHLLRAGMIPVGKTNLDEFAMGSSTETSFFGPTRNPWNPDFVPGGSSGGSAAAVASGEAFCALGSDTGGSVRQPAAFCGITGIKPTYGAVSRYGLIAFASSLDQIGVLGKTAEDCAALLGEIMHHDPRDSTSVLCAAPDLQAVQHAEISGMRIGIPTGFFGDGLQPDVRQSILKAVRVLETLGATVESFDLPMIPYAIPTYYILSTAEASSNLSRYDGIRFGYCTPEYTDLNDRYLKSRSEAFGKEAKRRILLGSFVLSADSYEAYYRKAQKTRAEIRQAFYDAFSRYDLLLTPTAPTTAFRLGAHCDDPLAMYLEDVCTVMVNLVGLPALSLPCGFDSSGLPVGMQFIGNVFAETTLLRAAAAYQHATDFHLRRPPLPQKAGDPQ